MKEVTRRVLKQIMTNKLACEFNYMGSGGKHAFSALILKDVLTGAG